MVEERAVSENTMSLTSGDEIVREEEEVVNDVEALHPVGPSTNQEPAQHGPDTDASFLGTCSIEGITEDMYQAVLAASNHNHSGVQFPGRDKLIPILKKKDKDCGRAKGTFFTAWKSAVEILNKRGLIDTIPNSGTFVSYTEVGNIGNLLKVLQRNMTKNPNAPQAFVVKPAPTSNTNTESESDVIMEVLEDKDEDGVAVHSSEEEIAAGILTGFKLIQEPKPKASKRKRKARKQSPNVVSYTLPTDFELNGPWEPKDDVEHQSYMNFLDDLIHENNNVTHWTHARLQKSVAAIFGVLHAAPRGLPRIELRNTARAFVGDTGLLDYTIKVLVNKELCGFYMKRETDSATGKLLYYAEYVDEETRKELLAYNAQAKKSLQTFKPRTEKTPVVHRRKASLKPGGAGNKRPSEASTKVARSNGKRKVHSPKRFADYTSDLDYTMPPKKRYIPTAHESNHRKSVAAARQQQNNPLPPELDSSYINMQQRLNAQQGKMIASHEVSCKQEVKNFISGVVDQFRQQMTANTFHAVQEMKQQQQVQPMSAIASLEDSWVQACLREQIIREISGLHQDMKKVGEQLKQVDPLG